jgi:hypothetical protein
MAMSCKHLLIAAVIATGLTGCNTIGSDAPGFGEAVKYNAAVQTINPAPVYAANAAQPGDNGDKGAAAVKRYRTDTVKDVATVETTQKLSTGGGSPQ